MSQPVKAELESLNFQASSERKDAFSHQATGLNLTRNREAATVCRYSLNLKPCWRPDNARDQENKAKCVVSRSIGQVLPRHLVSMDGVALLVGSMRSNVVASSALSRAILGAICIPSPVKQLPTKAIFACTSLSITFAFGSKLSSLEFCAFSWCSSLSVICLASLVPTVGAEY
jgi:hypothetical protein